MIKKHFKTLLISSAVTLLPLLAGLILWDKLPETIATHWGANGEPNGWSSKLFAVAGLPLILLALHWLCVLAAAADSKKQNMLNSKLIHLVFWLIPTLSILCQTAVLCGAMGISIAVHRILPILLGILFLIIGSLLPNCPQSYTMGIKLPWTLADEDNWRKTHRVGGIVWMIGGALCIVSAVLNAHIIMIIAFIAMILIPTVYSYVIYKRCRDE